MIEFLFSLYFLVPYITLNFYLSLKVYNFQKIFYDKKININPINDDESKSTNDFKYENVNIHDNYPEFRRYDNLSFSRIFLGMIFIIWIRLTFMIILNFLMFISVNVLFWKKSNEITHFQRRLMKLICNIILGSAFFVMGISIKENRFIDNDIYSKYLGPGKYENFEENYSVIISNHISWVEILYYMKRYSAGFISKASVKDFLMIGLIAQKIDCLFLDRTNQQERENIVCNILIISLYISIIV